MENQTNPELIDRYLRDELTHEEQQHFDYQMSIDPSLAEEVSIHKIAMQAIMDESMITLKSKLKHISSDFEKGAERNTKQVALNYKSFFLVAASLAIILIVGYWLFFYSAQKHEILFAQYYTPYQNINININRSVEGKQDKVTELFSSLSKAYGNKNYEEGIELLQAIIAIEPANIEAFFYMGHCFLHTGDSENAIASFEKAIEQENHLYYNMAQWYLALAYLKKENIEQCKRVLSEIAVKGGFYKEKADNLLRDLDK